MIWKSAMASLPSPTTAAANAATRGCGVSAAPALAEPQLLSRLPAEAVQLDYAAVRLALQEGEGGSVEAFVEEAKQKVIHPAGAALVGEDHHRACVCGHGPKGGHKGRHQSFQPHTVGSDDKAEGAPWESVLARAPCRGVMPVQGVDLIKLLMSLFNEALREIEGRTSGRSVSTVGTLRAMAAAMPASPVPEPSSKTHCLSPSCCKRPVDIARSR
eukprot:CAMPEP_0117675154 /NCGR_PEP_ID=MMETSP0804-20121206/15447_1 /TAXON_ID=1074897 /ORGANISM="Tetraselmis astigmatica, Strain CCMP880" /LENGTH=214 /DNA_ID=CAMNT_0005484125 /DNA_START=381 /DNA_END=1027 /DNA_ORIENTATION=-